jgi:hypothetical protein
MPRFLAWFITFNFVNLSFVFFRAQDWASAMKVFKGMAGQTGVILPRFLGRLPLIGDLDVQFGKHWLAGIQGKDETVWYLLGALVIVLTTRNSIQMTDSFKPGWKSLLFILAIAVYALLNMSKVSEFLYFQF